uniref:Uncharacterized protein n=1 Tax=Helianthus annuus TaxID=4232 RepID=A0A251VT22_HELAN
MSGSPTDDPKLFVSPPVFDAHATPPELQNSGGENGDKEKNKPHTSIVAYLNNKLSSEKADGRKYTVSKQWK